MKKNKEESAFKKKIKELKSTTRGKAILKLIRWGIFFLCLFIFCLIASFISDNNSTSTLNESQVENNESVTEEKTINTLIASLNNSNFNYEYTITINNETLIFNGIKTDTYDTGYKNTSDGIIKYYIDSTGIYEETVNERKPLSNLYENLDADYFDISRLVIILNEITFKETECDCINLVYEGIKDNITYTLELDNENTYISHITINTDTIIYDFKYSNVEVVS